MNPSRRASTRNNPLSGVRASVRAPKPARSPESLRAQRVSHSRLLEAIRAVPRQRFIPAHAEPHIAEDQPVLLGEGRSIPPVHVVVMMLGALELKGTERVLDIGGGSGYQAAILSQLAREVVSVEVDEELAAGASQTLKKWGCTNVQVMCGDASAGWPAAGPYQAIVVGAAASKLPVSLIEQLDLGGRLVIPLGDSDYQLVERLRRRVDGLDSETIGACRLDLLASPDRPPTSFPWTNAPKL